MKPFPITTFLLLSCVSLWAQIQLEDNYEKLKPLGFKTVNVAFKDTGKPGNLMQRRG